ncbi:hypothetical protein HYC85_009343 [Camellia sinensis]|uniref:Uncharacterized protein n=1 Tax=Camellia sinensis TaxID=4442 RepID=A0A7J7HFC7_CAMSI|nr:hypothetical protein HYC85_009343 [Camellia sinensis]
MEIGGRGGRLWLKKDDRRDGVAMVAVIGSRQWFMELYICRVEDILVEGCIEGSVVHFHRARTITIDSLGTISASGMGCTRGVGKGKVLSSGGGHGGIGGVGCYNGTCIEGGIAYGDADLPCELGSGSGNESIAGSTAGGGIIDNLSLAEITSASRPGHVAPRLTLRHHLGHIHASNLRFHRSRFGICL